MKTFLAAMLVVVPTAAGAGELATIAGRYSYADYAVALPSGRVLKLGDLNATSGSLEVSDSDSITLRLTLSSGEVVVQTAHLLEAHFSNGAGYWRAKWPDMSYPVRTDITVKGNTLTTVTKFDNPFDEKRYGSVERASLRKVVAK
ncbi:MAG: hypothetical protein ACLPTM_00815 [Steroidobacteraceae bacterium]